MDKNKKQNKDELIKRIEKVEMELEEIKKGLKQNFEKLEKCIVEMERKIRDAMIALSS